MLSFEQCIILFQFFLFFLRLMLGAKVLSFVWSSPEWPFIIITHAILPNSRTLDGYPLRQNWAATLYYY